MKVSLSPVVQWSRSHRLPHLQSPRKQHGLNKPIASLLEQEKSFNPSEAVPKDAEYWQGMVYRQTGKKMPRKGITCLLREGYDIGSFVLILCQHVLSLFLIHKVRRRVHFLHPFSIWPLPQTAKEVTKAGNACFCGVNVFPLNYFQIISSVTE